MISRTISLETSNVINLEAIEMSLEALKVILEDLWTIGEVEENQNVLSGNWKC
jgi:hypothetical protein